ncbi:unnamed protein product [Ectocarpus sp. CCAP 1310/34]|nr:unnamed protein product [Ectocarpus sp. CCAP 1310/34]
MTAEELLKPGGAHSELNPDPRPWSPPVKSTPSNWPFTRKSSNARKRPRTSSALPSSSAVTTSPSSTFLPPHPPYSNNYINEDVAADAADLGRTRPPMDSPSRLRNKASPETGDVRPSQLPLLHGGGSNNGSSSSGTGDNSDAHLSKSAKLLEEDRKKVASIRSFLLNFLEERDCSIKKRLVTDVGMWCIARHTTALRELNVGGCHGVTNIGLRSLAICCDKMEQLNFTSCTRLTDLGLRVIGGGCWSLKSLSLEGCSHVSDTGVAEIAKLSTGLTYLNISRCERVGEYGDRALIQLGRSCHQLTGLDAFGCSHAQDPGLLSVARGCPKLEKLMLTGCGGITGRSVRALARGCSKLRDLSLSGCGGVGNGDLKELARGCTSLRHLNIAQCRQVNAHGLAALARGLKNLTELDVGGCEKVDDSALRALCSMNAHFLNLSGCSAITETGVTGITMNCTALSSLNVTGCPRIGRRFMAELCHSMKLSEPAQAFFGFQADTRRNSGTVADAGAPCPWAIQHRSKAIIRGYFARKWYRAWRAQVREQRAAAAIQATWRMLGDRRTTERLRREKLFRERGQSLATRIQAGWWGYRSSAPEVIRWDSKHIVLSLLILFAEVASACKRSGLYEPGDYFWRLEHRRLFAQKELLELRRLRNEALAREKRNQAAALLVQSLARMRQGRAVLAALKARRDLKILEWEMALKVQAAWRGRVAKMMVMTMRILREQARQKAAAITIQSFWRAVRARHLATIQRALFKIRQMQDGASKGECALCVWKGKLKLDELTHNAAKLSERQRFVATAVKPLRAEHVAIREELFHIRHTTDKYTDSDKVNGCRQRFLTKFLQVRLVELKANVEERLEKLDAEAIEIEVKERHNTRVLRQTERELIPLGKGTVEKVKLLRTARLRKKVSDSIAFASTDIALGNEHTTARSERSGSITIQRIFRGWRVRRAINSWYRDYWIESEDAATGDVYYVNTWNQEIRWVKPLEISLFEESSGGATNRPGTANPSKDSDAGEELGVDTVSSRFRKRLVELTGEATRAAEEEERFLRHVVANIATISASYGIAKSKGGDEKGAESAADQTLLALAAAREWRFVSTDSRFSLPSPGTTKNKCWYREKTSDYFWGGNPPLLGLLPFFPENVESHEGNPGSSAGRSGGGGSVGTHSTLGNEGVVAGGTAEGGAGPPDAVAVVHPELGLVFVDRASGEAWLKTQDLGLLLKRSEKVCDIGRAGWCQLKAAVPSETAFAAVAEDGIVRGAGSTSKKGGTVKGPLGVIPRAATAATTAEVGGAATAGGAVPDASRSAGSSTPRPLFTFFHHAQLGEARWCLSPRSALLATPRTPRREASHARLASAGAQGWDSENTSGVGGNDEHSFAATGLGASAFTTVHSNGESGDGWEVVEDGDMVFYYNERLRISTWEPPPGWA